MFTCRSRPSFDIARLHINNSHNQHNTSLRRPHILLHQCVRRAIRLQHLTSRFTSRTMAFLISFLTGRQCFFPFSPFTIFPTETGAKNKRPQARPRAKESVMIPTLLMNIPTSPKQPNNTIFVCKRLWFFLRVLFFVFCSFTAAWNGKAAYIGIEGRRKESALEVETGQTEGERNQVVTPLALVGSLSRVRPSCWK
jgi:hypothetical protein